MNGQQNLNQLYKPKGTLEGGHASEQKAGILRSCLTKQAAALFLTSWLLKESDIVASYASSPPLERIVCEHPIFASLQAVQCFVATGCCMEHGTDLHSHRQATPYSKPML